MRKHILSTLLFVVASLSSVARADTASQRVVLRVGNLCPGMSYGRQVVRIHQNPDGTSSSDASEFVVPSGMLLEITDIELEPAIGPINHLQNSISLYVQNRSSLASYTAASFAYGVSVLANYNSSNQQMTETSQYLWDYSTRKWSFTSGPYVGPAGRLCVGVALVPFELPDTNTSVILRGRLVSDGTISTVSTGGLQLSP